MGGSGRSLAAGRLELELIGNFFLGHDSLAVHFVRGLRPRVMDNYIAHVLPADAGSASSTKSD